MSTGLERAAKCRVSVQRPLLAAARCELSMVLTGKSVTASFTALALSKTVWCYLYSFLFIYIFIYLLDRKAQMLNDS